MTSKILLTAIFILLKTYSVFGQTTIYVNHSASGLNNGSSWIDAYTNLQFALSTAPVNSEIWVSEGVYTPGDSVTSSFELKNQCALFGGFKGDEISLDERNPEINETILSGDIGQDDIYGTGVWHLGWNINTYNSHHVVSAFSVDNSAVLDGFTIMAGDVGHGFGWTYETNSGGGLYNINGSPVISNCKFYRNLCYYYSPGAGIYSSEGSPIISNCLFLQNYAQFGKGAGLYYEGSGAPIIEDCRFEDNYSVGVDFVSTSGSGMHINGPSPATVKRCVFEDNYMREFYSTGNNPTHGGGFSSAADGQVLESCIFIGNTAHYGGGASLSGDNNIVVNCLFANNTGYALSGSFFDYGDIAGGLYASPGFSGTQTTRVVNSTFTENTAGEGAGLSGGNFILENSIVWGNIGTGAGVELLKKQVQGVDQYHYSDVQYLFTPIPGEDPPNPADFPGCLAINPQFVGLGDYHIISGSPVIDAADADRLPAVITTDLEGLARAFDDPATINTGIGSGLPVDMGCYEFNQPCNSLTMPSNLLANPVNPTKVDLSWEAVVGADAYQITGGILGASIASTTTTSSNKSVNGLIPGATYAWQVRSRCVGSGVITNYSLADTFTMPVLRALEISDIQIYPNPAVEFVTIGNVADGAVVTIWDVNGKMIKKDIIHRNLIAIDYLHPGIYHLEIVGTGMRGKFVKK